MKKRFLPVGLLLVSMMLGQSMAIADNGEHYVPRSQGTASAEAFMSELRANQHTGLIDPALMIKAAQNANVRGAENDPLYWVSMGPDNMGGQTTAILYDNTKNAYGNPNGVVYIGSKGGGVYKTYNHGITWHQVANTNLMVSCLAQDADGVIYVGTGDGDGAATYNGLSQQSYDNSFVGSGIYTIVNDELTQIASTAPTDMNNVYDWSFVNDLLCFNNTLVAATNSGLRYSSDKGATWTVAKDDAGVELTGQAMQVKVMGNQFMAAVDGKVYIGQLNALVCHSASAIQYDDDHNIVAIPAAAKLLDIAVAPSDANVLYASCIDANGVHTGIYVSENGGETWSIAQPASTANLGHDVYSGYGLNNHGIVVDPSNAHVLYVMGYDLWELRKQENSTGYYLAIRRSNGSSIEITSSAYLHVGLHCMVFNPNNNREFYIGTDGGIYKGAPGVDFTFANCNRNYVTTRMFNVAYSNNIKRVMGAALNHGTIMIEGNEAVNHETTGNWVYPNGGGSFSESYQPGPCAISSINNNTIFVTTKNGGLQRSETAGADWVSTNFTSNISISSESFRMPIVLFENFNDEQSVNKVWAFNETNAPATTVQAMSNNDYPFTVQLSEPLAVGDSIEVKDPITAKFYIAYKNNFYMTMDALQFSKDATWYLLSNKDTEFKGEPLSMGITADGDNMFVGFKDGKFVRISNLNTVVDASTGSMDSAAFQVTTTVITLPIEGQCVTSVAVDPRNANNVVVTLGNYGNESYVLYSTDALSENPTFVSKQANLPKMPVYSAMIEMTTGYVLLGTEHGVYMAKDIANPNWTAQNTAMGDVPVMDIKQQINSHPDQYVMHLIYDATTVDTTYEVYEGIRNTGMIYAATYGKGLYRCENFRQEYESVVENPTTAVELTVGMYPNPVRDFAKVSFEVAGNANVNYVVYDITGRVVMTQNLGSYTEGSYEVNVNMSNLRSGAYILRLNQGANSSAVKFMVY